MVVGERGAHARGLVGWARDSGESVEGKAKLGVQAFADSLLVIPKVNYFLYRLWLRIVAMTFKSQSLT